MQSRGKESLPNAQRAGGWRFPVAGLMAAVLLLAEPAAVQAQLTYTVADGYATITGFNGTNSTVVIPSVTNGYPVIAIAPGAFQSLTTMTSIVISNGLATIGSSAFRLSGLTSVALPNSVTNIGSAAFYQCYTLGSVTLGTNVTILGDQAFEYCLDLTNVVLPNSLTSIGMYEFSACGDLGNISLPSSITSIGAYAFDGAGLTNITLGTNITNIANYAFEDSPLTSNA